MSQGRTEPDDEVDVLGSPYRRRTMSMPPDYEGAVVATVVSKATDRPSRRGAVLHVHGFCDYFFQTGTADFFTDLGFDFYAVDLRKYGRSWLAHQTPNFCLDVAEYFADLDAALDVIRAECGVQRVLVHAHSTGGLIAALWAAQHVENADPAVSALVLNSAWLDLAGSLLARTLGTQLLDVLGRQRPYTMIPRSVTGVYAETLHRDFSGEWNFNLQWKPKDSFSVYAGWLRAIRRAHHAVHRGIDVAAPVLSLCSARSSAPKTADPVAFETDTVLDVDQISRWSVRLGTDVTVRRIPGALHDVFLSRRHVREDAFAHTKRWLSYALPSAAPFSDPVSGSVSGATGSEASAAPEPG